ncbi:hypothetical protein CEP54_016203 [Fusarium duplospermum]|uniref:Heterokaryon incompatibility domain-containing protein n=1 Tax=Fusarium duplospermum TaxID=1325734 RepID=A0A428NGW0_9HYPO|nr:hypothetical protein CEP54_016203 [Fusarium duplospermum]
MVTFRLINLSTGVVSEQVLGTSPPYLAASHAWSEQRFPLDMSFLESPGRQALKAVNEQRFAGTVDYCWVDTICINQQDDADMNQQIPLMGRIFGDAIAVVIVLSCNLRMSQASVDRIAGQLKPAVRMHEEEEWAEQGAIWRTGHRRKLLIKGMRGLARLTTTPWATRVWTLQEYILASQVIWIGKELVSLVIPDILFPALPDICDTLIIEECLGDEFHRLFSYFSGMANSRLARGDRTRVMELLGNRSAELPRDEVYGIMAASGVEISTSTSETNKGAWSKWFEQAVSCGHLRWLLMPVATFAPLTHRGKPSCILPAFDIRHKLSASSCLDTVKPLGLVRMKEGTVIVDGRWLGVCTVEEHLGTVHEPVPNQIHRDITLVLFSQGKSRRARKVASAFGGGRYNSRQISVIATILKRNFRKAVRAVKLQRERDFRLRLLTAIEHTIWGDFMEFQMGQMPGMNEGTAYLAQLRRQSILVEAPIVLPTTQAIPSTELGIIDLGARTIDGRCVFMIVAGASADGDMRGSVLHRVAVTLPVTGDYENHIAKLPLREFAIGGEACEICQQQRVI